MRTFNPWSMCSGARFGFELEEELKVAASCEEVKEALENKVSRERIGHEVRIMMHLPVL